MKMIEEIKHRLELLNACNLVDGIADLHDAIDSLFTPQGSEFFRKTKYPALETLRAVKKDIADMDGVFLDSGNITLPHPPQYTANMLIAGDSHVNLTIFKPIILYHIIVAHNASLTLNANDYAVATITVIGDCKVEVINDGTAKVTIERKHHG